jgi:hypothetical protein
MAVPVKTGVLALALLAGGLPAAALAQAAPAAAAADAPVATAAGHAASPGNTTAAEIQTYESAPVDTTADGQDGDGKRKIHGYVEVGVGNRGYREVDGAVTVPVGKDGQATVAISDAQGDGWRR